MLNLIKVQYFYQSLLKQSNNPQLFAPLLIQSQCQLFTKPYFQMPSQGKQNQKKQQPHHGRHKESKQDDKKSKKKKKDDDDDRSGGLLEPIIEDLQGWIKKRRPLPAE